MKIKQNPVLYILLLYICLGVYLLFSFYNFQQYLAQFPLVNLTPVAYGLLVLGGIFIALPLFSLFRIPLLYYLFKMIHLWIVVISSLALWVYFQYGQKLSAIFNVNTPQSIATIFPVAQPEMFTPLIGLVQSGLKHLQTHLIFILLMVTIVMAIIQIILYLPSSLRYVYYTHVSPLKYLFKHVLLSLVILVPVLFAFNLYLRSDTSLNPKLETLLAEKATAVKDSDNAFYPLLTLWLPEETDSVLYGKRWLSDYKKLLTPSQAPAADSLQKLALGGIPQADQEAINQLYVQWLQSKTTDIAPAINSYITKYQRQLDSIQSIYHIKSYQSPVVFTDRSFTKYYSDFRGSFLVLERLSLLSYLIVSNTDATNFGKRITDDYNFNLRIIKNSSDQKTKQVYTEKQSLIAQFLYKLLFDPKHQNTEFFTLVNHLPLLAAVLDQQPIAQKDLLLLKSQLDRAKSYLANSASVTTILVDYTFKYNKTLNCLYQRASAKYNLINLDMISLRKRPPAVTPPATLDNVIGNVICKAGIPPSTQTYAYTAAITNGRMMILKVRSKIYEDRITDANIATYLNNHSSKYYNPFTGQALKWDRDNRIVYFQYHHGNKDIRVNM